MLWFSYKDEPANWHVLSKDQVNEIIKKKGEEAAYECGVFSLDPRIVQVLGRLHFRTSYGQNVLEH